MSYIGELLALFSAFSFAMANVTINRTKSSRGDKGVLFSVLVTISFSAMVFIILEARRVALPRTGTEYVGLAYFAIAGVSAMAFGRSLVFQSIQRLGAARASAVKRLNPFFSVLMAAVILSEPVTRSDLFGLVAIALAFGILLRGSLSGADGAEAGPLAYGIGAAAALAYAVSYIARKAGLGIYDAPALGTLVSALSGLAAFAVMAGFSAEYRTRFREVFRNVDRPIFLSALLISVGQILMFAALSRAPVSTVVMISSLEIFFSIFLVWMIYREDSRLDSGVMIAALFAVAGVILVASG